MRHLVIHGCEAVAFKMFSFLGLPTLACVMEVFGWLGRFVSSFAPASLNAYTVQCVYLDLPFAIYHPHADFGRIVATVIAPTPLLASNFLILGIFIRHLGEDYSRLSSRLCE